MPSLFFMFWLTNSALGDNSVPNQDQGIGWVARCRAAMLAEVEIPGLARTGKHLRYEAEGLVFDVVEERDPAAADAAWHWTATTGVRSVGPLTATVMVLGLREARDRNRAIWTRVGDRCLGDGKPVPARFNGRYILDGAPDHDECGTRIVLAARHIEIDDRTLRADVVDRTYEARVTDGKLVGWGSFDSHQCDHAPLSERWVLARVDGHTLAGTLESTWRLAPDCHRQCTVRFLLRAVASDDGINPAR
jgi:hypothetical protein